MSHTGEGVGDENRAWPAEHVFRRARILVLSTIIATSSVACRMAPLATLDAAQDPSVLGREKGTLVYFEDDRLCLFPIDGASARRLELEKKPDFIGGIDAKGRIVYSHSIIGGSLYDMFFDRYAPGHFRYEVRVVAPGAPESVLMKGAGFVHGLALSTDGRLVISVVDDSLERGGTSTWSMKVLDLDTREKHEFPMEHGLRTGDLTWSRDERSVLYTAGDAPAIIEDAERKRLGQQERDETPQTICELDASTGDVRTVCVGARPVPVLDADAIAIGEGGSYRLIDERSGETLRPPTQMPGADLPYEQHYLIAAPGADRPIYRGLTPAGTNQLMYFPGGDLWLWRMWSVHMADMSQGKVATIVWQTHADSVVFSRVDLARAIPHER